MLFTLLVCWFVISERKVAGLNLIDLALYTFKCFIAWVEILL